MPKGHARKMHNALLKIAEGHNEGLDIKWMKNLNCYRLRLGNYRAQYEFLDAHPYMVVGKIGVRGGFYK